MPTTSKLNKTNQPNQLKTVYLVDGIRTPFFVQAAKAEKYSSLDLSVIISRALLLRHAFSLSDIDSMVSTTSHYTSSHSTIEREYSDLAFNLVQRLNSSNNDNTPRSITFSGEVAGFQGLEHCYQQISLNQQQLMLISGVDTLQDSNAPSDADFKLWKQQWHNSQGIKEKYQILSRLHTNHFNQHPNTLNTYSGQQKNDKRTEQTALIHALDKQQMTDYAQLSQRRLQYAQRNALMNSVIPLFYPNGQLLQRDEGVLLNSTTAVTKNHPNDLLEILPSEATAPAADGATLLLLASEEAVKQYQLPVLAELSALSWANGKIKTNNTKTMINQATQHLLTKQSLTIEDINYWEINETSAVDILIAQKSCPQHKGIATLSHVNIDGGALSLGNPPSANSLRIVLQLANILKRNQSAKQTKNKRQTSSRGLATSSFPDGRECSLLVRTCSDLSPFSQEKT